MRASRKKSRSNLSKSVDFKAMLRFGVPQHTVASLHNGGNNRVCFNFKLLI